MHLRHHLMLARIQALCSSLTPDQLSVQEEPRTAVEEELISTIYQGVYGVDLPASQIREFYSSDEGFFYVLEPYILLGCALNIAQRHIVRSKAATMREFMELLLDVNGAHIDPYTFSMEAKYYV